MNDSGRNIMLYTCSYIPLEIILAAGFTPRRLLPDDVPEDADSHIHTNTCSYIKSMLAYGLSGAHKGVAGIIFANSCDGVRKLYDIWLEYVKEIPAFFIDVPKKNDKESISFYASELKSLCGKMQNEYPFANIDDKTLSAAIDTCNRFREGGLNHLATLKSRSPSTTGGQVADALLKAAEFDPGYFDASIGNGKKSRDETKVNVSDADGAPRILIMGSHLKTNDLETLIEKWGGRVVCFDKCMGLRCYSVHIDRWQNDPLEIIAKGYLEQLECFRRYGINERIASIQKRITNDGINGIVYSSVKFCEQHAMEYPVLAEVSKAAGVPFLFIENDYLGVAKGQVDTRIQAFVELIAKGGK